MGLLARLFFCLGPRPDKAETETAAKKSLAEEVPTDSAREQQDAVSSTKDEAKPPSASPIVVPGSPQSAALLTADSLLQGASVDNLKQQETTLRALLEKAKNHTLPSLGSGSSQAVFHVPKQLSDPELQAITDALMRVCTGQQRPGPDVMNRVEQLLGDLLMWLEQASSPQAHGQAAATLALYQAGMALAQSEFLIRSCGHVRYWTPGAVNALLALLKVYQALVLHSCSFRPGSSSARSATATPVKPSSARRDSAASHTLATPPPAASKGGSQTHASSAFTLVHSLAQLLIRSEFLDMCVQALGLVLFSTSYREACGEGSHEPIAAAMQLMAFITLLIKFVATQPSASERVHICTPHLVALLDPRTGGAIPRVLDQAMSEKTLAVQLHALRLLKQLFGLQSGLSLLLDPKAQARKAQGLAAVHGQGEGESGGRASPALIASSDSNLSAAASAPAAIAAHYTQVHATESARYYLASQGDPASAAAQLCHIHMDLLCALSASDDRAVRVRMRELGLLDFLVRQLALEAEVLSLPTPRPDGLASGRPCQSGSSDDELSSSGSDSGSDSDYDNISLVSIAPGAQRRHGGGPSTVLAPPASSRVEAVKQLDAAEGAGGTSSHTNFTFSGDMNEDVERLMAMEEAGHSIELKGFEYDEEGLRLLSTPIASSNSALAEPSPTPPRPRMPLIPALSLNRAPSSTTGSAAASGRDLSGRPPVPKLSLASVRSIASSRVLSKPPGGAFGSILTSSSTLGMSRLSASEYTNIPKQGPPSCPALPSSSELGSESLPSTLPQMELEREPSRTASTSLLHHSHATPLCQAPLKPATDSSPQSSARKGAAGGAPANAWASKNDSKESSARGTTTTPTMGGALPPGGPVPGTVTVTGAGAGVGAAGRTDESSAEQQASVVPLLNLSGLPDGAAGSSSRFPTSTTLPVVTQRHSSGGPGLGTVFATAAWSDCAMEKRKAMAMGDSSRSPNAGSEATTGLHAYERMLSTRLLYKDATLHALMVRMVLSSLITPSATGDLDLVALNKVLGSEGGRTGGLEYLLTWHLSSEAGVKIAADVSRQLDARAAPDVKPAGEGGMTDMASTPRTPASRLLRLLSRGLFDPSRFANLQFHARGASGNIYRAKYVPPSRSSETKSSLPVNTTQAQVMIKAIELAGPESDRSILQDVYGELAILERFRGHPGICQLIDYGITGESYWIVMRRYRCSLAEWRLRQTQGPSNPASAVLYLSILQQVVDSLKLLVNNSVVHFDLKCANILLDPLVGVKDGELWNPLGHSSTAFPSPPFHAVLADFGEARSYRSKDEAFTARDRGTEVYKSPEMLLMNQNKLASVGEEGGDKGAASKAAVQMSGAGMASDVWSFGCLAYELLSGKVLFDGDYATVTHRVAFGKGTHLILTSQEKSALGDSDSLVSFIEWILVRNPLHRPSLDQVVVRIGQIQAELTTL